MPRLPFALRLYQLASAAGSPAAPQALARRRPRGKEHPERLFERRGETSLPRPQVPLMAARASVGEMLAVVPLIERLRAGDSPCRRRRTLLHLPNSGCRTAPSISSFRSMRLVCAALLDHSRPDLGCLSNSICGRTLFCRAPSAAFR